MSGSRDDGFTLVELLVTISILAIVSLLLSTGIQSALKGNQFFIDQSQETNTLLKVDRTLRTELKSALPFLKPESRYGHSYFVGRPSSVRYLSSKKSGLERRALLTDSQNQLIISNGPFDAFVSTLEITNFKFSFFGKPYGSKDAAWHHEWIDQTEQPNLVKLTMENGFSIIVPLQIDRSIR